MPIIKRLAGKGLRALAAKVEGGQVTQYRGNLPTAQRPFPPPYASPPDQQMPAGLESHPMTQMFHRMLELMHYQERRLQELENADDDYINVHTTHNIDRRTIDNSYRYDSRVDNRRFTHIDSRHIEAKQRLHPDWCFGLIIAFIIGFLIVGSTFGFIKP